jgi:hypothetical protein
MRIRGAMTNVERSYRGYLSPHVERKSGHSLELRIAKQCRGKKDNPATR